MNEKPESILLKAVVGSTAYGLNTKDSDVDYHGIFAAPTLDIAGFDWNVSKNTWTNASPEGDDETYHEIAKFLKLMMNGGPNTFEVVFAEDIDYVPLLNDFIQNINKVYGYKIVKQAILSYAKSVKYEIEENKKYAWGFKPKSLRAILIKGGGIESWLGTGIYSFSNFDTNIKEICASNDSDLALYMINQLVYDIERTPIHTDLNEEPDMDFVKDFLRTIRKQYM